MTLDEQIAACPDSGVWAEVVAGVIPEEQSRELLSHASRCERCAVELRLSLAILAEDDPPAAERAGTRLRALLPSLRLMALAACIILIAFIAWRQFPRLTGPPFNQLVRSYQLDRRLNARLPGAAYSPVHINRSANPAPRNLELAESETSIRRHLSGNPYEPDWLHALALAETVDRQFDQAILTYRSAASAGLNSALFWAHYAIAYQERGVLQDSALDLARSIELSSKALQLDATLTAALGNRAIAKFHLHLYGSAMADLEAALRSEQDPRWRQEMEDLLAQCRSRLALLLESAPPRPDLTEMHFEEALRVGRLDGRDLAKRLEVEHRDRWLRAAAAVAPAHSGAIAFLARVEQIRFESRLDQYASLDEEFARWLLVPLPPSLKTWRDFEWIYRISHSGRLNECPDGAAQSIFAEQHGFPWFAAQIAVEFYTCKVGVGDETGNRYLARAMEVATAASYSVVQVRVSGIMASQLNNQGDYSGALDHVRRQLDLFLQTRPPARRAHEFFAGYRRAAESMQLHHTALAAAEAAASVAASAGYRVHEIMDLLRAGEYAFLTSQSDRAADYFRRAEAKAGELPSGPDLETYLLRARLGVVLARGAIDKLPAMSKLGSANNLFFQPGVWLGFARLALDSGQPGWAEDFLTRSVRANRTGLLRRDEDQLRSLLTAARLHRNNFDGALRIWALASPENGSGEPASVLALLGKSSVLWDAAHPAAPPRFISDAGAALRALRSGTERISRESRGNGPAVESIRSAAQALGFAGTSSVLAANGETLSFPWSVAQGDASYVVPLPLRRGSDSAPINSQLTVFVAGSSANSSIPILRRLPRLSRADLSLDAQRFAQNADAVPSKFAAALAQPGILHFSGHAIRWKNRVALVLNPEPAAATETGRAGLFTEDSIGNIRASLVFLAACSTAQYEDSLSILPGHIAEALIDHGAQWVVAALWDIDDAATSLFTRIFYAELRKGASVPAAVAAARHALRTSPDFGDPHFWAAFTLYHNQLKGFKNASTYQEI